MFSGHKTANAKTTMQHTVSDDSINKYNILYHQVLKKKPERGGGGGGGGMLSLLCDKTIFPKLRMY